MGVVTTGDLAKALWPGINSWWGRSYNKHPEQWKDIFEQKTSSKSREEVVEFIGLGLAPIKAQGASIQYASQRQGFTNDFNHEATALGFIVTHEQIKDNQYEQVALDRTEDLAFSMRTTKEIRGANSLNRAFDPVFAFGDGKSLIATDHVTADGAQSNRLAVDADLSEVAIEDLLIQIGQAKNSKGLQIAIRAQSLIIPVSYQFEAQRILGSVLQNNTDLNAVNALKTMSSIPNGAKLNNYLTDDDAWFIITDATRGLCHFQREALDFSQDNDFDTKNLKYAAYERDSFGVGDWRGIFGSSGA